MCEAIKPWTNLSPQSRPGLVWDIIVSDAIATNIAARTIVFFEKNMNNVISKIMKIIGSKALTKIIFIDNLR